MCFFKNTENFTYHSSAAGVATECLSFYINRTLFQKVQNVSCRKSRKQITLEFSTLLKHSPPNMALVGKKSKCTLTCPFISNCYCTDRIYFL
ncbi:hypothetical protein XELAEV_18040111mg [Xenopus laevis]|uniref:Uncharacterized protein n=1 Tax=Xenopus laevis TaxID=8355 RepID=A0A974C922_XENLA|nr:hypothetical protein XELAEV_18040111mg [Xenopus laevis]